MRDVLEVNIVPWRIVEQDPNYANFLRQIHPKYEKYTDDRKYVALNNLAGSHPRLVAEIAQNSNSMRAVSTYPTSSQWMDPVEQKFLSKAMQRIQQDIEAKPFHRHGESGVTGNKKGEITWFGHKPGGSIGILTNKGTKYILHNHPPYDEPFCSSASGQDHLLASKVFLDHNSEAKCYLTNGKDVFFIPPDSTELIKLIPRPAMERFLGKFPVAFTLPKPQQPSGPFANNEAPATFKAGWEPPAGWKPPEDYPRTEFFNKPGKPTARQNPPATPRTSEQPSGSRTGRKNPADQGSTLDNDWRRPDWVSPLIDRRGG
ncbi:MAG TPA: hypothetical protein VK465_11430 [Fibrobacteria bacterium]|nr:hypothetical protein [Fibrobacteria bacterium]